MVVASFCLRLCRNPRVLHPAWLETRTLRDDAPLGYDILPDSFQFTWTDGLGAISFCPEDIHLDDFAKAGESCEGSRRAVGLKIPHNVADHLRRLHS